MNQELNHVINSSNSGKEKSKKQAIKGFINHAKKKEEI